MKKRYWMPLILICLSLFSWKYFSREDIRWSFKTASIEQGDLLVAVNATGTLEPEELVDVGAQVAGKIVKFGVDRDGQTIDYGSFVEEGTVLANIDDSVYAADVTQAEAQVSRANADLLQLKAKLYQAEQDWKRTQRLISSAAISESNIDSAKAAFEIARANVSIGEASVIQAQAALVKAQRNLSYCIIKSPVQGVIIDRRVNIGQTVVASLNAPSLFLLAKDLKKMQVWVQVNEADIGNIKPQQAVKFNVDAFPGEIFEGVVRKIRLNATMNQNVVSYTVEVNTDNSSGRLLPYLTANVKFEVSNLKDVLLVPNSALRWIPKIEQIAPSFREKYQQPNKGKVITKKVSVVEKKEAGAFNEESKMRVLWILEGQYLRPIEVTAGGSDGIVTEIKSTEIKAGQEIVLGEDEILSEKKSTPNPFAPQVHRGRR